MKPQPIHKSAGIRAIEQAATKAPGAPKLMERAGIAAAELARSILSERGKDILVLAGPGNNGGDAFEAATHLKRWFYRVAVVFTGERGKLPPDAAAALAKFEAAGGTPEREAPPRRRWDLVVDGLFGIGLERALAGRHAEMVEFVNGLAAPVLALDIPSGINADTGAVIGAAVRAAHTITFIALKPGLLTADGPDHCGRLTVDSLGVDPELLQASEGALIGPEALAAALAPRSRNYHKGHAGTVGILGGAEGMVGAAVLAGRAALKCGAGRVNVGLLAGNAPLLDWSQPELMLRRAANLLETAPTIVAAGPGMGRDAAASAALEQALVAEVPLVLDADALNLLAAEKPLREALARRRTATLLTPHPAEAARLLGSDTRTVQSDRIAAARELAAGFGAAVALKGNGTVIADRDGRWWINSSGNPGMASAGMGDALTGIVAGLLAQGAQPLTALIAGVYLHGAAADASVKEGTGPLGITATEVIDRARALLNRAIYPTAAG